MFFVFLWGLWDLWDWFDNLLWLGFRFGRLNYFNCELFEIVVEFFYVLRGYQDVLFVFVFDVYEGFLGFDLRSLAISPSLHRHPMIL